MDVRKKHRRQAQVSPTPSPPASPPPQVKKEPTDDDEVIFIGSRPASNDPSKPAEFGLEIDDKVKFKKRKEKPGKSGEAKRGRPKKYLWDETAEESEFELSDLEPAEIQATTARDRSSDRRRTSRWVCYSADEDRMFAHWLVQGRSVNYIVKAYRGMRSRNGVYQKMAAMKRAFPDYFEISKKNHFQESGSNGMSVPGPIPREHLVKFKWVLYEMRYRQTVKGRISGSLPEADA